MKTPTNPIEEAVKKLEKKMDELSTTDPYPPIIKGWAITLHREALTSLYNKGVNDALGALPHFPELEIGPNARMSPAEVVWNECRVQSRLSIQKLIIKP